jgi:hypothetical protein
MKILLPLLLLSILPASALSQYGDDFVRKEGKFGLSVMAGPAFPSGEFADLFKSGFTGFVAVPYNITEEFQVYVGLGYSHFNAQNEKLSAKLQEQGETATADIDAPYSVIPAVLGLNYSYRYKNFWPYFTMSLGLYFQRLQTSGSVTINGVPTSVEPKVQTWSQGAFAVGIGSLIPLGNESWAIDINAKFNSVVDYQERVLVTTTGGNGVSTRAIRYISILGGLSYTFR